MTGPSNGNKPITKCPNCGDPTEFKYRPFCSKRCWELDFGKWMNESYTIPVVEEDDDYEGVEDEDGYEH